MNAYFGTSSKFGFEFAYTGKNKILYGMGFSTTLTTLGVGEDYTGIMRPDQFDEMFEVVSGEDVSVYGIVGYQVLDKYFDLGEDHVFGRKNRSQIIRA
jgi:mannose-6-phosphate isomerase-like protein (cupin superfamily)